jgi:hypothetical protein
MARGRAQGRPPEAKQTTYLLVTLTNEQAVLIDDGQMRKIGEGNKNYFNGFNEM